MLTIPLQDAAISTRHEQRVQAHKTCLQCKIVDLLDQQAAILAAIAVDPTDRSVLPEDGGQSLVHFYQVTTG